MTFLSWLLVPVACYALGIVVHALLGAVVRGEAGGAEEDRNLDVRGDRSSHTLRSEMRRNL
jgi:hypothetical protein